MLLAASPTNAIVDDGLMGSADALFFNKTSDSRTARLASCRCVSLPKTLGATPRATTKSGSSSPSRCLKVSTLSTASSMRSLLISPRSTCCVIFMSRDLQSYGVMLISMPALMACAHDALLQPGTCAMPFQSLTTIPSNPNCPRSMSVNSG